jgi:ParB family chromosome partitioning protein
VPSDTHLGRGLEGLLPTDFDNSILLGSEERIQNLFLKDVQANANQPRKHFDDQAMQELAESVREHGVLQPIIVSPSDNGTYEIIAGERRWRAAGIAKLKSIPAIVRERAAVERLEIALIENVQRVDLSPLEQAQSIVHLHDQFNLSYQDIAQKLGKAAPTVHNLVRLLQLPDAARLALQERTITEGHARAILALKDKPELQEQLLKLIVTESWSVRQAEQFVNAHKEGIASSKVVKERTVKETVETKRLARKIGTKVTIHHTAKGGRLEIHFKSDKELEDLYQKLG